MGTYFINYDLIGPETSSDYKDVKEYIEGFNNWAKPLKSSYFIISDKRISDIRDELQNITDNNDKIVVLDVSGDNWATSYISKEITDWMQKFI